MLAAFPLSVPCDLRFSRIKGTELHELASVFLVRFRLVLRYGVGEIERVASQENEFSTDAENDIPSLTSSHPIITFEEQPGSIRAIYS